MLQRLKKIVQRVYKPSENKEKLPTEIYRILDQQFVDTDDVGACQTCAIVSAIESKYKSEVSYKNQRDFYLKGNKAYKGAFEKVSRAMKFMTVKGIKNQKGQRVYSKDYTNISKAYRNYNDLKDICKKMDCVVVGLSRNSAFFTNTGNIYKEIKLPYGHAGRLICLNDKLYFVNSWGKNWARKGYAEIPEYKFDLLKFWEVKAVNFIIK